MLRREESNKVLKEIKAVLFAGALSLSCPMNVEAQEVVYEQQEVSDDSLSPSILIMNIAGGCLTMIGVVTLGTIGVDLFINYELKHHPLPTTFLGKLKNGNHDDINEAVKYLKLTNGIK